MTVYSNPYGGYSGDGSEVAGALGAYFGCVALFGILIIVLELWLFYRILTKAGYNGWLTLLNLIPFGAIALTFLLALGDWPSLRGRGTGPIVGGPGYPPTYQPPQSPMPPTGPGYQPPAPPMAQQPGVQPPVPPAQEPVAQPPVPPAQEPPVAPVGEEPPAPPSA